MGPSRKIHLLHRVFEVAGALGVDLAMDLDLAWAHRRVGRVGGFAEALALDLARLQPPARGFVGIFRHRRRWVPARGSPPAAPPRANRSGQGQASTNPEHSAGFDRPDFVGAFIHRDDGQFAVLGRQAAQVIHDRLPFLDLAGPRRSSVAVATLALSTVPAGASRSGVSLRGSSSASTFDVSGWPSLFLATSGSLPLVYFGMATRIMASIKGAREAVEARVLAGDVDGACSRGRDRRARWRSRHRTSDATGRSGTSGRTCAGNIRRGGLGYPPGRTRAGSSISWPVK